MNATIVENIISWLLFALASTYTVSFASTAYDNFIGRKRRQRESKASIKVVPLSESKPLKLSLDVSFGYEHVASVLTAKDPGQAIESAHKALALLDLMLQKSPDEPRYLRRQIALQRLEALALLKQGDRRNAIGLMRDVLARIQ